MVDVTTTTVNMAARTDFRTLWAREGFDPAGHVYVVDENGALTGDVELYGDQSEGPRGSGRAATIMGYNLKGCGPTLSQAVEIAEGSKKAFYTSGLLTLREAIAEAIAGQLYNHFFGNHNTHAVVNLPITDSFGKGTIYAQTAILVRDNPTRMTNMFNPTLSNEAFFDKIREVTPGATGLPDIDAGRLYMQMIARQQGFLWARRIMVPNFELGNVNYEGIQFDAPIVAMMKDYRDVWCCNGMRNRESIIHAIQGLRNQIFKRLALTDEEYEEQMDTAFDIVQTAFAIEALAVIGFDKARRDLVVDEPAYLQCAINLVTWLAPTDACSFKIFDSEYYFEDDFTAGRFGGDFTGLIDAIYADGAKPVGTELLVDLAKSLVSVLDAQQKTDAEAYARNLATDMSSYIPTILKPSDRGWVAHRHNMAYDQTANHVQQHLDNFMNAVKLYMPDQFQF